MSSALLDLIEKLAPDGPRLLIIGGFGLVLKTEHRFIGKEKVRHRVLRARSTNDIDMLLTADVIVDSKSMQRIREALDGLEYQPKGRYWQFEKMAGNQSQALIELHSMIPDEGLIERTKYDVDKAIPRIRAIGYDQLHAWGTPEAFSAECKPHLVPLQSGERRGEVLVPNSFAYLSMKSFALRDRLARAGDPERQRYDAYDLFRIWSMMTEQDFLDAETIRGDFARHPQMIHLNGITSSLFGTDSSTGMLALRNQLRLQGSTDEDYRVLEDFRREMLELLG